jgi:hypothetical protein
MPLGDGVQDRSAVLDDFLIAEVYKKKTTQDLFFLFLVSLSFCPTKPSSVEVNRSIPLDFR